MTTKDQVVDQWFLSRWGRFTASENYKLLSSVSGSQVFSLGALTYIKQKALEMATTMWERPELEENKALMHGKMYEYPAYKAYIEATRNYSMKYLGTDTPLFLEYEPLAEDSGGSPDIINMTSDFKIDAGAEIKCPKNPMYHMERLKWKTQWDIKEAYPQCYCQMQNLMMITGAKIWQFISFDERFKVESNRIKIIDVHEDRKFQDNLDIRLRMAVKEKYKVLQDYQQ